MSTTNTTSTEKKVDWYKSKERMFELVRSNCFYLSQDFAKKCLESGTERTTEDRDRIIEESTNVKDYSNNPTGEFDTCPITKVEITEKQREILVHLWDTIIYSVKLDRYVKDRVQVVEDATEEKAKRIQAIKDKANEEISKVKGEFEESIKPLTDLYNITKDKMYGESNPHFTWKVKDKVAEKALKSIDFESIRKFTKTDEDYKHEKWFALMSFGGVDSSIAYMRRKLGYKM